MAVKVRNFWYLHLKNAVSEYEFISVSAILFPVYAEVK